MFERLTYWNEEYGCWSYKCASGDAAKRLAAYEDTGLTPEQIQAQQQEINKFRTERDMEVSKTNKLYAEIRALTADKDEQTEQMKYLLRRTLPILEATNNQQELIEAIDALLGGKEDED